MSSEARELDYKEMEYIKVHSNDKPEKFSKK